MTAYTTKMMYSVINHIAKLAPLIAAGSGGDEEEMWLIAVGHYKEARKTTLEGGPVTVARQEYIRDQLIKAAGCLVSCEFMMEAK